MCIIAGYPDQLDRCFFSYNEGLKRRFTFRYEIKAYDESELMKIFLTKINQWNTIKEDELLKFSKPIKIAFHFMVILKLLYFIVK